MIANSLAPLFQPFTLKSVTLRNRFAMAPMTRSFSPGGNPTPEVAAYYRRRAENDVGLIITEGTVVDHPVSSQYLDAPNFFGDALSGWRRVVEEVHGGGGSIFPQLWHVGTGRARVVRPMPNPDLPSAGPSGLVMPGEKVAEPMTQADIDAVVDAFRRAAGDARRLGFDGIELHGAHGYLIDQFFWQGLNERDDRYAGGIEERGRFAIEIIEAVRREVGNDYPVIFRFSQWKIQQFEARLVETPEELERFLTPLAKAGVDLFHCSQRRFWIPEFPDSNLNLAGWTKKLTGVPTMSVGSVGLSVDINASLVRKENADTTDNIGALATRIGAGEFDLIAIGRALLLDPQWVRKIKEGRYDELQPFTPAALTTLS